MLNFKGNILYNLSRASACSYTGTWKGELRERQLRDAWANKVRRKCFSSCLLLLLALAQVVLFLSSKYDSEWCRKAFQPDNLRCMWSGRKVQVFHMSFKTIVCRVASYFIFCDEILLCHCVWNQVNVKWQNRCAQNLRTRDVLQALVGCLNFVKRREKLWCSESHVCEHEQKWFFQWCCSRIGWRTNFCAKLVQTSTLCNLFCCGVKKVTYCVTGCHEPKEQFVRMKLHLFCVTSSQQPFHTHAKFVTFGNCFVFIEWIRSCVCLCLEMRLKWQAKQ